MSAIVMGLFVCFFLSFLGLLIMNCHYMKKSCMKTCVFEQNKTKITAFRIIFGGNYTCD